MTMEPYNIQEIYSEVNQDFLAKLIDDWLQSHKTILDPFRKTTDDLLNEIDTIAQEENFPIRFNSKLEATFHKYFEWTESLDFSEDANLKSDFLELWKSNFESSLENFPKKITITIKDSFWNSQKKNKRWVRIWKWQKRRQIGVIKVRINLQNRIKWIFSKSEDAFPRIKRSFNPHQFLFMYMEIPLADFFIRQWQIFLQRKAKQMHQLHISSESIKNISLFPGDSPKNCIHLADEELSVYISEIRQQIQSLAGQFDHFQEFKNETLSKLSQEWKNIFNQFQIKWEIAGTFLLKNKNFSAKKITKQMDRIQARLERIKKAWENNFVGEREEWQKDIELSLIQLKTAKICIQTIENFHKKIEEDIVPVFSETGKTISFHLNRFNKVKDKSKTDLRKAISNETRILVDKLRKKKLPLILDALIEARFDSILQYYLDQIKINLEIFSEQHLIFRYRDLENFVPKSQVDEIPFRLLIEQEIFPALIKNHEKLAQELHDKFEEVFRDVSEIDQIVEYNLETALNILKERKDSEVIVDSRKVVLEGLERSVNKVHELIQKNHTIENHMQESLLNTSYEFINKIQDLEDSEKVFQLQLRFARAKAKEKIKNYRITLWNKLKTKLNRLKIRSYEILKAMQSLHTRFRKLTGLAPTEKEVEIKLTTFLIETQQRIAELPFVYNRLFRIEPISDERFFGGRADELSELNLTFSEWRRGQFGLTALIGEKGSGKTTLINLAKQKFLADIQITELNLVDTTIYSEDDLLKLLSIAFRDKKVKTIDELEDKLRSRQERSVFIFENIQNLFLRRVDGFDALERFLLFVSRTDKVVFWLITCTIYSWKYLDKVLQMSKFFKKTIELGALQQEEMESIILKRHRISGYQLYFEIPEEIWQTRQFRKIKEPEIQQKFLKDMYFDQLNKLSAGNITVAMSFWLSAIRNIDANKMILSPNINLDYSFLHQLSADELFTLTALLQHETLNAGEHATIFHLSIQQSLLLLHRLKSKKIIIDVVDRFQIHHLLYRPVVAVLKAKNIIH